MFYFASYGNDVFLSCANFSKTMADSLGFEIGYNNNFIDSLQFKTELFEKPDAFYFKKGINNAYFSKIDSTTTWSLGTQINTKGKSETNFIKVPYKNGFFYLHLQPVVFTNYYLLNKNIKYTEIDKERMMKVQGRVKWFNAEKGFGFIDRGEGKDVFVHYSQIVQNGYKTLNEGELVEFELYQSERGMQAKHVVKI